MFEYSPIIDRPEWRLPNDARIAVYIGLNVEHYELNRPSTSIFPGTAHLDPDPLNYGWRDYGVRVGIWRVADVLDRHAVRASVLLNSDVCEHYPRIIEEGNKRDWVWAAHGKNNSTFQHDVSNERHYLEDVLATIHRSTGQPPVGWLGPALTETYDTIEILEGNGIRYVLDWCNDDQPCRIPTKLGRMISVPYSIEVNDIPLFVGKSLSGEGFLQIVKDQFDTLYAEGSRVMAVGLHPFIIGQPFRIKYLDLALEYISDHDDVWLTTSDEIADWFLRNDG
ncbi:MAG: polysaccharide deacetylase family protein [archaeon]